MPVTLLVAGSLIDGRTWLREHGMTERGVVIVTPRAPDRARGVTADRVLYTRIGAVLNPGDQRKINAAIAPALDAAQALR